STSRLPSPSSQRPRSHHQLSRLRHPNVGLRNPWTGLTVTLDQLPGTVEDIPTIRVLEHVLDGVPHPMADVYIDDDPNRVIDLSFGENAVIGAHPFKSGGDWWYGTTVNDGGSGVFPQTYVRLEPVQATAVYSCEGSSPDKLSFAEDDVLTIVNRLESDWGRAEWDGVVCAMPAV
ncbi:hypothetical protein BKA83DRAFT_4172897, partial [Pisolithus microcarpus]